MSPDFESRVRALAGVVVRVGLNLQPGQPLLLTDPYDLQGVHPAAAALAGAVQSQAGEAGCPPPTVLTADPAHVRSLVESDDLRGYDTLVADHTRRLQRHLARGGAFLFLTGSAPQLLAGLPPGRLARFEAVKWRHFGPVVQRLIRGASQWTLLPAPTPDWATAAGVDLPALWDVVFAALRLRGPEGASDALSAWHTHLAALAARRDTLDAARHRRVRYTGPGTDLTVTLPRSHRWCTTQLVSRGGVPFVVNLPTEEVFTAPHRHSATGTVRVSRPVAHNGCVIAGIALEFRAGRVVRARADAGEDHLHRLLATDPGAARLGEVALVPGTVADRPSSWQTALPVFHHILLDENAGPHIALGDAYRFCSRAWFPLALNSSQLHLDLPLDAEAELL